MTEHAARSPSGAERWFACPGSIRFAEGLPDETTPAAAEGTFAHEVAATCLRRRIDAAAMLGHSDVVHTVDESMAEHVQTYLDAVREHVATARRFWIEQRVELRGISSDHGTLDAGVLRACGTVLDVYDLKFGAGVYVDPVDNLQCKIYALAALLTFPLDCDGVERVVIHIVQPRHFQGKDTEPVTVLAADLRAWGEVALRDAIAATEKPDAPLVAGDHCQFCRGRMTCPELRRQALTRTQHLFTDSTLEVPAKYPPPPDSLTPTEIAVALRAFPVIERWLAAVREHAYTLANRGEEVPGFKLVATVGHRKWKDPEAAALALGAYLRSGLIPFEAPKIISPAEADRRLAKDLTAADKAVVEGLAAKSVTGSTLVPVADRRPAISRADVFDELPQSDT